MLPPVAIIAHEEARRTAALFADPSTPALVQFVKDGNVSADSMREAKRVYLKPLAPEQERKVEELLAYLGAMHLLSEAKITKAIEDNRRRGR